jgi:hypothetical protein
VKDLLVDLARGVVARHMGVSLETMRREVPIGSRSFVEEMVGRYGELGIAEIILPVVYPYDFEALGRLSETFA